MLLFVLISLLFHEGRALARDTLGTKPGVWCERRSSNAISARHEQRLVSGLARITGFCDLHFTPDGELSLGDTSQVKGGAVTARQILLTIVSSHSAFVIEDCSGSDDVNFGQVLEAAVFENVDGMRIDIWRVQMDFNDFQNVQASLEVRTSFDEGFILLHELLHGLGYADASRGEEIGGCEEIVNQARSELGLPLRDHYFVAPRRVTDRLASARIRFRSQATIIPSREEVHYLYFVMKTESGYPAGVRSAADRRR